MGNKVYTVYYIYATIPTTTVYKRTRNYLLHAASIIIVIKYQPRI